MACSCTKASTWNPSCPTSKLGEYGEMQHGWTAEEAKGFIKVLSTPLRVYYGIHGEER